MARPFVLAGLAWLALIAGATVEAVGSAAAQPRADTPAPVPTSTAIETPTPAQCDAARDWLAAAGDKADAPTAEATRNFAIWDSADCRIHREQGFFDVSAQQASDEQKLADAGLNYDAQAATDRADCEASVAQRLADGDDKFRRENPAIELQASCMQNKRNLWRGEALKERDRRINAAEMQVFADALTERQALIAKQKADYEAQLTAWREQVRRCEAGERAQCNLANTPTAPTAPSPPQ